MSLPFEPRLKTLLKTQSPHRGVREVLEWATLPPGKLFRPKLVEALGLDAKIEHKENLIHLGLALEIHHAYSLVHDDMPCMDNDDLRRGKAATHKQFGEWRALLAGDVLLAMSYAELENIESSHASQIRKIFHWATGPKGLILGQWIDLGLEGVNSPATLLRMHELKTARLMQVAALCTAALSQKLTYTSTKAALRLGSQIGLVFQLLDDLDDLTAAEISAHEQEVNPFLLAPEVMTTRLDKLITGLTAALATHPHTKAFLVSFLRQSALGILSQKEMIRKRLPGVSEKLQALLTSGVFV